MDEELNQFMDDYDKILYASTGTILSFSTNDIIEILMFAATNQDYGILLKVNSKIKEDGELM